MNEALQQTGTTVVNHGQALWQNILVPIFSRLMAALPQMFNALVVLIFFWILGKLAGALVTKVLGFAKLDDRAMKDWGLGKTLTTGTGQRRSLEKLAGTLTKWIISLFGVIAFLQVLDLEMVAAPLQNVLDHILSVVPNLLKGILILLVYWIVGTVVRAAITRGLDSVRFNDRVRKYLPPQRIKGDLVGPSDLAGRLFFYAILLFSIPPFLQALGQESLVGPLQQMLGKGLGFLPNVFAAAVILLVGYFLASIVREIVTNFIGGLGADSGAEKLGLHKLIGKRNVSQIVGTVCYFFILIPVIVSAVDTLGIRAISDPVKHTLEIVMASIPTILVATIVVVLGYAIARAVRELFENFLSGVGFDALPDKLGLDFLKSKREGASLSKLGGTAVMVIILLLTAQQALATLGLVQLAAVINMAVLYLPRFFAGIVIFFAALSLGAYVGGVVKRATSGSAHSQLIATVARYVIIFFGASMALDQLGIGKDIVTVAVSAVLGGAALALGLAFGLGGKEKARAFLDQESRS